jgi:hypothetical protein
VKTVCYITYCSRNKKKSSRPLSAIERYQSPRIHHVHELAKIDMADFRILSGRFGLLREDEQIPWYDHLLKLSEVKDMVERVAPGLSGYHEAVFYYVEGDFIEPYLETVKRSAEAEKVKFSMKAVRVAGG